MRVKFTPITDTSNFDKKSFLKKIDNHPFLRKLDITVELERIYPANSSHLVVFRTKNTDQSISKMLDEYFFNLGGAFQIYSEK